jgi:predicted GH43/DUF377 family glycosyl hydrolase
MPWKKQGLLVEPDPSLEWSQQYAMMPTPILWDEDRLRVFFGTTDREQRGHIAYVDLDARDPSRVLDRCRSPLLDPGDPGTFDDSGVVPSCYLRLGQVHYLYYVGFQRAERVPYMLFIGLAKSVDGGKTFQRWGRTPLIERTRERPFSIAAPYVLPEARGLRMWYWFASRWIDVAGKAYMQASIGYAESTDPERWEMDPRVCVDVAGDEFTVGRPWVVATNTGYRMWYSKRSPSTSYRLGLAESADGTHWVRHDDRVGIDVSPMGWDSEMICYPAELTVKGKTYLFYNGNGNGKTGFGYAEHVDRPL